MKKEGEKDIDREWRGLINDVSAKYLSFGTKVLKNSPYIL